MSPMTTMSKSPSSSFAWGATYIPPPKARLFATATEEPLNVIGSMLLTLTLKVAGRQAAIARMAA